MANPRPKGIMHLSKRRRLELTREAGIRRANLSGQIPRTRLARMRAAQGLTLADVAKELRVSRSFIWAMEHGRKPVPAYMIRDLAELYRVKLADLAFAA